MEGDLTNAVKRLRLALGDTQQSFANRLGLAISTAVRYETTRPPKGPALMQLAQLAHSEKLDDLAQIFGRALTKQLGIHTDDKSEFRILDLFQDVRINTKWKSDVEALLLILKNPKQCATELAEWRKIRDRVQAMPRNEK